ncbi:protocadherin Fat 1-like [Alosa sapidissima]|uniref:protocadherin Fat 1-like n=1 Tax=Alosa sapidissima TaxID=34773 RepID=UPI001C089F26|nr:protocadherin Fat 1-like [Alosa sapidissima]
MVTSRWIWTVLLLGLGFTGNIQGFPARSYNREMCRVAPPAYVQFSYPLLSYTVGDASALVFTKKPLDAEALKDVRNNRTLALDDINDNAPVFEKKKYTKSVSEAKPVGSWVIEVQAFDSDVSPLYSSFRYSIEPPSATFTMAGGLMLLQEQLNYTLTKLYNLTVKAKDSFGKAGETTVVVHVLKPPGLHFEHDLYNAMIHENEVGQFLSIYPAPIKAFDGVQEIIYSINKVSPGEYWGKFSIQKETGVINIDKELDREKASLINMTIMASLKNDSMKTADTMAIECPVYAIA